MLPPDDSLAQFSRADLLCLVREQGARLAERDARIDELARRVAWFERQLFGSLSERRILQSGDARQLFLGETLIETPETPPAPGMTVQSYERAHRRKPTELMETDSRLRFGPGVPVQVVEVPNPDLAGLDPDDYEVIDERCCYRLAQKPGAYVVLKYVRKLVKIKPGAGLVRGLVGPSVEDDPSGEGVSNLDGGRLPEDDHESQEGTPESGAHAEVDGPIESEMLGGYTGEALLSRMSCPPVPAAIFERSFADVSFLAGMAVDKFLYHLPLYRQHQRLEKMGVHVHRGTLTRLVHRTAELLEPIHTTILSSVLQGPVLTVDETPTKAGRANGKMQKGYFWGFYGAEDEVAFVFSPSRSGTILREVLRDYEGKLLTDGYEVYNSFAGSRDSVILHQCWGHTRRMFIEAEKAAPEKVNQVLSWIQILYAMESRGREGPESLLPLRQRVSRPAMEALFSFLEKELNETALLPSNPFVKAATYAVHRKTELMRCLDDAAVPLDTNHLEREFRPHAVGRKNWMFHVTEVGARAAGIFYTLIRSCVLAQVDPTVYLVDILQRVQTHPALDVHLLAPRLWRGTFGHAPMKSHLAP